MLRGTRVDGKVLELQAGRFHRELIQNEIFDSRMHRLVSDCTMVQVDDDVSSRVACVVRVKRGKLNAREGG